MISLSSTLFPSYNRYLLPLLYVLHKPLSMRTGPQYGLYALRKLTYAITYSSQDYSNKLTVLQNCAQNLHLPSIRRLSFIGLRHYTRSKNRVRNRPTYYPESFASSTGSCKILGPANSCTLEHGPPQNSSNWHF